MLHVVQVSPSERPEYLDAALLVKLRPTAAEVIHAQTFGGLQGITTAALLASPGEIAPGLSFLSTLIRGGLVKRIVPLRRSEAQAGAANLGSMRMMAADFTTSAPAGARTGPLHGVSFLELQRGTDARSLQTALSTDRHVEFVSRVPARYLAATTTEPSPPGTGAWNLRRILWPNARLLPNFNDGNATRVAVLDSGVDTMHPDLAGRIQNYVYTHDDLPVTAGPLDFVGHGTHVAGIISALGNNFGVNGISAAQLQVWKIFGDTPSLAGAYFEYVVDPIMYRRALADCADAGVEVVNVSVTGTGLPDFLEEQLYEDLVARGITVVAAMGNDRAAGSPTSYPAALAGVLAVGATSLDDTVAMFSSAGTHIAVSAPGVGIWSTLPTYSGQTRFEVTLSSAGKAVPGSAVPRAVGYDAWQGTSMAAPHVAAAAALAMASLPGLDAGGLRQRLIDTADRVAGMPPNGPSQDFGAGRLNLLRLLTR